MLELSEVPLFIKGDIEGGGHLQNTPRVPTYVNAYSTIEASQRAALACIVGNQPFVGVSPLDAFAGAPDAQ